jgi:uncharacterized protein YraI
MNTHSVHRPGQVQSKFLAVLGFASMLLLGGCFLDRTPIIWNTDVRPSFVCPGDSVQLSYNTAEGGCLGDGCPEPIRVNVVSVPDILGGGLTMHGSSGGAAAGPITSFTNFTFTTSGGRYGHVRSPSSHSVDVILPFAESPIPIRASSSCSGDALVWQPVELSIPDFRSEAVRLVRVCNYSSDAVTLSLVFDTTTGSRRWTLLPGACTEDLPAEEGTKVVRAFLTPIAAGPPVRCTTSSSGPGPGVELIGLFTCDLMTASEPIVAASPEPTAAVEIIQLPTITPTETEAAAGEPIATFTQNGNCRRGPGSNYDVVTSLLLGQQVPIAGRNAEGTWWYLTLPSNGAHCWASGAVLELAGPYLDVPLVAAPPTPTLALPPAAPSKLVVANKVCNQSEYSITLNWIDNANNEGGYRVYYNGALIATLGPNATSYQYSVPSSSAADYAVEAFNAAGASERIHVSEDGCLV